MKITRKKLRQLIAESLNEMHGSPMSLDALKPMMDQQEYSIIKNNIMRSQKQLGFYIIDLEETFMPNRS